MPKYPSALSLQDTNIKFMLRVDVRVRQLEQHFNRKKAKIDIKATTGVIVRRCRQVKIYGDDWVKLAHSAFQRASGLPQSRHCSQLWLGGGFPLPDR